MSTIEIESDYDQNCLAEKYLHMKYGDHPLDKRHLFASMDAENIIRLLQHSFMKPENELSTTPIECALDVGCGQGDLLRVLLKEKLVRSTVGVDRSSHMIEHARTNTIKDTDETHAIVNATTEDLFTNLGRQFPLVIQSYMLSHAENIEEFSKIVKNIGRVCSGSFIGLISNPQCDFTSEAVRKLKKHGVINRQYQTEEEVNTKTNIDGVKYRLTFNRNKDDELTLVDHWYSPATYEKVFREAGFQRFQWMPLQVTRQEDYLIDLIESSYFIAFLARIN